MEFEVLPLPYAKNALVPHLSADTLELHYEKHHKGYMAKLHKAIEGTPAARQSLEDLVRTAEGAIFNNAAQVWNHSFYWLGMHPEGGGAPTGRVREELEKHFGSWDRFTAEFSRVAKETFGSGWTWLAREPAVQQRVISTSNAENPLQKGLTPLLTIDVWEHAYYLDYRNERPRYVDGFLEHLVNWEFVERNLFADTVSLASATQ